MDNQALKAEYIAGNMGYRQLAEKYSIPLGTICAMAKKGDWVRARAEYKAAALDAALDRCFGAETDRLEKIIRSAVAMTDVIAGAVSDKDQFYLHLVEERSSDGRTQTVMKKFGKVDSKAIKDFTSSLRDMVFVLRNLYELPTQAERESQRIAAERLKIEREKADREAAAENRDRERVVTVVFENGMEELTQ